MPGIFIGWNYNTGENSIESLYKVVGIPVSPAKFLRLLLPPLFLFQCRLQAQPNHFLESPFVVSVKILSPGQVAFQ